LPFALGQWIRYQCCSLQRSSSERSPGAVLARLWTAGYALGGRSRSVVISSCFPHPSVTLGVTLGVTLDVAFRMLCAFRPPQVAAQPQVASATQRNTPAHRIRPASTSNAVVQRRWAVRIGRETILGRRSSGLQGRGLPLHAAHAIVRGRALRDPADPKE